MSFQQRIALTTGDIDGVGLEVTLKALLQLDLNSKVQFYLFRSPKIDTPLLKELHQKYSCRSIDTITKENFEEEIVEVVANEHPASWVEESTQLTLSHFFNGLVTAPLSKTTILNEGYQDLGHTQMLKRLCKCENLFMAFWGQHFSVVLVTDHIPLNAVEGALSEEVLRPGIEAALRFNSKMHDSKKPIGILGLNPHSGEQGLIGKFEQEVLKPILQNYSKDQLIGPLVPDAAFSEKNLAKYDLFLSLYHDQGLIPFKMAHGNSGVHITLGLPFVRTSVDHGTAKDIFSKNIANSQSMKNAILLNIDLNSKGTFV